MQTIVQWRMLALSCSWCCIMTQTSAISISRLFQDREASSGCAFVTAPPQSLLLFLPRTHPVFITVVFSHCGPLYCAQVGLAELCLCQHKAWLYSLLEWQVDKMVMTIGLAHSPKVLRTVFKFYKKWYNVHTERGRHTHSHKMFLRPLLQIARRAKLEGQSQGQTQCKVSHDISSLCFLKKRKPFFKLQDFWLRHAMWYRIRCKNWRPTVRIYEMYHA